MKGRTIHASGSRPGEVLAVPDKLRSALKPAQEAAVAALEGGGLSELTRARYEEIGAVSRSQAAYDLADLVTLGILDRVGKGRATRYRLAGVPVERERPSLRAAKPSAAKPGKRSARGGRPRKWTEERIRTELDAFCARSGRWPRAAEFHEAGRSDLYLAASRYGGVHYWATELGLRKSGSGRPGIRVSAVYRRRLGGWAPAVATMLAFVGFASALVEFDHRPWALVSVEPSSEDGGPAAAREGAGEHLEVAPADRSAAPRKKAEAGTGAGATAAKVNSQPRIARILLVARRGSCWLAVRRDSAAGKTVYEGILDAGRTLKLRGNRFWLRLGAPHNIVARLDGRPLALPERTSTILITSRGSRVAGVLQVATPSPAPPASPSAHEPEIGWETPMLASSTMTTSPSPPPASQPPPPPPPASSTSGGSPSPKPAPPPRLQQTIASMLPEDGPMSADATAVFSELHRVARVLEGTEASLPKPEHEAHLQRRA